MAAKKQVLATDVHVEKDGDYVVLPAGSAVPSWAKDLVVDKRANGESRGLLVDADADEAPESDTPEE